MNSNLINGYIENRFSTLWGSTTDVVYDNVKESEQRDKAVPYASLTIVNGDSFHSGIGTTAQRFRNIGRIIVQVFIPLGRGTSDADTLIDSIVEDWRGAKFNGVNCGVPQVVRVGETGDWFQKNVSIPFKWDSTN